MTEGEAMLDLAEERAKRQEENLLSQGQGDRFDRWVEFFSAVVLSLATVLTAWCGYQAALWGGAQDDANRQAATARIEAGQQHDQAMLITSVHVGLFSDYVTAYFEENQKLVDFYYKRFPPALKTATEAWLATDPQHNPDAPLSPFDMAEYHLPQQAEADRLAALAEQQADAADKANQSGDHYMLLTVIFAMALFFCGISGKFQWRVIDMAMLVMGTLVVLGGVTLLLRSPML